MSDYDKLDCAELACRQPWTVKLLIRLFGRLINRFASSVILRAYERGVINSHQLHSILKMFDPTQDGAVGLIVKGRIPITKMGKKPNTNRRPSWI